MGFLPPAGKGFGQSNVFPLPRTDGLRIGNGW
jgi:hypothetical protein